MGLGQRCTYFTTTAGANVTISTKAGALVGYTVYGSDGGTTVTIVDSDGDIVGILAASSLDGKAFAPTVPIALQNGLSVTASGTGGYSVYFI